jgi:hypothetical protein
VDPEALMEEKGCFGCHQLDGVGRAVGPSLAQRAILERLEARFDSDSYARSLAELDRLAEEPFSRYREARAELSRSKKCAIRVLAVCLPLNLVETLPHPSERRGVRAEIIAVALESIISAGEHAKIAGVLYNPCHTRT